MTITIAGALSTAQQRIDAVDARALLCHVVARDAAFLIGHPDEAVSEAEQRAFEALVARRAAGEPFSSRARKPSCWSSSRWSACRGMPRAGCSTWAPGPVALR
jgi:release factor glutamine methyltransferase